MKTLFVIGGMGSGKSTVTQRFAELGAPTIDLDKVGHEVLLFPETKQALSDAFGADIFDANGEVVRSLLAEKAFASPRATELLNGITTTRIIDHLQMLLANLAADTPVDSSYDSAFNLATDIAISPAVSLAADPSAPHKVAVVEVSAYDGPKGRFADIADAVIAVVAPVELRVSRAVAKGFDGADVRRRLAAQATDKQRCEWADIVIENNGDKEGLIELVDAVWTNISAS